MQMAPAEVFTTLIGPLMLSCSTGATLVAVTVIQPHIAHAATQIGALIGPPLILAVERLAHLLAMLVKAAAVHTVTAGRRVGVAAVRGGVTLASRLGASLRRSAFVGAVRHSPSAIRNRQAAKAGMAFYVGAQGTDAFHRAMRLKQTRAAAAE